MVRLGPRSVAAVDTDVDALIDDLIIERDAAQLLLDSAADLNDRPGCAAVLRGMTYANERQQHHFLDRCIKTAKEIKAGAAPKPLPKSSKRSRAEVAP